MPIPAIASYDLPRDTTAYPTVPPWQLEAGRAALLVHDMQQYFLAAYDRSAEPIAPVLAHTRALIDACDAADIPVFYSMQPPQQAPIRRGLLSDFWGTGLSTDEEAAVAPELTPRAHHHLITKWRYSAFERTDLRQALACAGRDQLIITGVYGHMGCQVSAADAFMNDVAPFAIADAIADFSADDQHRTLDWIARRCGVVLSTDAALAALKG
ncbi:isochorismatase family protein [Corynebacterium sp. TAE3-ERU12]|uniref:isochorismatase family protein n=1 Tax=Corynebacterium sp. TAE3-ERU12 TaxID=2849491 RepID=UPI001C491D5A|nr:isochorismatase family protein [Corynebacterium sp. TAE3-ERU12]MBV7294618.1 isochorismatase family protein [Corynebacterium sp. TAE3-ERU12]